MAAKIIYFNANPILIQGRFIVHPIQKCFSYIWVNVWFLQFNSFSEKKYDKQHYKEKVLKLGFK